MPDVFNPIIGNSVNQIPHDAVRGLGHPRSPEWHRVEREHLAVEGWCRFCGGTTKLQVHHKTPFHLDPAKELDPTNLITLCEDVKDGVECHLHVGHLGNWKNFNPNVAEVAVSPLPCVPSPFAKHVPCPIPTSSTNSVLS